LLPLRSVGPEPGINNAKGTGCALCGSIRLPCSTPLPVSSWAGRVWMVWAKVKGDAKQRSDRTRIRNIKQYFVRGRGLDAASGSRFGMNKASVTGILAPFVFRLILRSALHVRQYLWQAFYRHHRWREPW